MVISDTKNQDVVKLQYYNYMVRKVHRRTFIPHPSPQVENKIKYYENRNQG